jgi:L-lactate dehydrogenase complex protein LldE
VVAKHWLNCFADAEHIVVPSGSCAAMVRVYYRELFAETKMESTAVEIGSRTWELSQFLTDVLQVEDVGAKFEARATVHDGCHGLRELGIHAAPRKLLENVEGLELVEMGEAKSCCGFGGTFAVKFPQISTAMAQVKCTSIDETAADVVISNDPSCLMQIDGYLSRQDSKVKCLHLAEVLAKR